MCVLFVFIIYTRNNFTHIHHCYFTGAWTIGKCDSVGKVILNNMSKRHKCSKLSKNKQIYNVTVVQLGANNGLMQHQKCVSFPPFRWATTRIRLRVSLHFILSTLMCFLNERCEHHHSPRNFVDSSTGRIVFPIPLVGGIWVRNRGAMKYTTWPFRAANLKPFLVPHSYGIYRLL